MKFKSLTEKILFFLGFIMILFFNQAGHAQDKKLTPQSRNLEDSQFKLCEPNVDLATFPVDQELDKNTEALKEEIGARIRSSSDPKALAEQYLKRVPDLTKRAAILDAASTLEIYRPLRVRGAVGLAEKIHERVQKLTATSRFQIFRDTAWWKKSRTLLCTSEKRTPTAKDSNSELRFEDEDCDRKIAAWLALEYEDSLWNPQADAEVMETLDTLTMDKFLSAYSEGFRKASSTLAQEQKARVENEVLPGIKRRLAAQIESSKLDRREKDEKTKRIQSIRLRDSKDCLDSKAWNLGQDLLKINATYEANLSDPLTDNTIGLCPSLLLRVKDDDFLALVVAHEAAHSVDPCNVEYIQNKGRRQTPIGKDDANRESGFPELISCLRTDKGFVQHLRNIKDGQGKLLNGIETAFKSFCENDQINEVFADRLAMESLLESIKNRKPELTQIEMRQKILQMIQGIQEMDRDRQEVLRHNDRSGVVFRTHPSWSSRMENALLTHPEIRKSLGCWQASAKKYCPIDRDSTAPTSSSASDQSESSGGQR